jgi:hypothetical protein
MVGNLINRRTGVSSVNVIPLEMGIYLLPLVERGLNLYISSPLMGEGRVRVKNVIPAQAGIYLFLFSIS